MSNETNLHNVEFSFKLKRIQPGLYESTCGRVRIERHISKQTYHTDEVCWSVTIDGICLGRDESTKRDAMYAAARQLFKLSTTKR